METAARAGPFSRLSADNDLSHLRSVVALLRSVGLDTWVFGGWAEELRGISRSRAHADIDLLYLAAGFDRVDRLCHEGALSEIVAKRFPHKRALAVDGVMVELFLVQRDGAGLHTDFWATVRHEWPRDSLSTHRGLPVARTGALLGYRIAHERVHEPRPAWLRAIENT
jgi:hypothetical protein